MTSFVCDLLHVTEKEAVALRRENFPRYGTTLSWLREAHGFSNIEAFLEATHPPDPGAFLVRDDRLIELLDDIDRPAAVLTNSPREHARRVLSVLGIDSKFEALYDIRYNKFKGKPNRSAYLRPLQELNWPIGEVLFLDDAPTYVQGFVELGGNGVLVDETGKWAATHPELTTIRSVHDLKTLLEA